MSHWQQKHYCLKTRKFLKQHFENKTVLDIGSLDINGNNRYLFDNCLYIGIDIALGKNVNIVSSGHELKIPDQTFDTIISTECFEHDMHYEETIKNAYRMLKDNGLLIFTCATTGREEHGTRRTTPLDAPLLQDLDMWSDYYKNLTENDIRKIFDIENHFSTFSFQTNTDSCDLYFYGIKRSSQNKPNKPNDLNERCDFILNLTKKLYRHILLLKLNLKQFRKTLR